MTWPGVSNSDNPDRPSESLEPTMMMYVTEMEIHDHVERMTIHMLHNLVPV